VVEAYQEPQEQAAGMLAMRWHWSSQETVLTKDCQEHGRQTQLEAELEAAPDRKVGGQWRVTCQTVRAVAAALPDGRDRVALRREQLASDRVKAQQNRLTNSAGFKEGDRAWVYGPTQNRKKSPKYHLDQRSGIPGPTTP
jgi:hypothetical protein